MKKQVRNFNPNLVLVIMVILCTIASYFVTPGAYDRETVNGITRVVATSYHEVARTPVSVMRMFEASTSFRVRASESPELHIFPAFSMLKIMPASCASAAAWRSPSI